MFSKGSRTPSGAGPGGFGAADVARRATPSIISGDLKIVGDLKSSGDLQIDGTVEGDIASRQLTVGEGAMVQGAIVAESVRIYGTVCGEIEADSVLLAKTARIEGNIAHRDISMEAGASVNGRLSRLEKPVARAGKPAAGAPAASAPRAQPGAGETGSGSGARTIGPYGV
ncbi:MAG: polymer-forming cytoskeletal protein [Kiloniellaceae bacterium]